MLSKAYKILDKYCRLNAEIRWGKNFINLVAHLVFPIIPLRWYCKFCRMITYNFIEILYAHDSL